MSFVRITIAAGAVALLMTPVVARAAWFTGFDNLGTFNYATLAYDNGDTVSINGGLFVDQTSGTVFLSSPFTFSFRGDNVGSNDNTPQTDYFVTGDNQVVAEFTWNNSDGIDTGVFEDFRADGVPAPTLPGGATGIGINGTVDFSFDGFGGSINVPEPATLGVLGIGLAGLIGARRRRA